MYGILKKKYGQNFLIDKNVLDKISNLITEKNLIIIEIGPGDGRLTEYVLKHAPKNLKIIEVDPNLIPLLSSKYNHFKNVKIINRDILEYELNGNIDLIISNLPYNISSQILVKICLMENIPSKLILMFQKEFAQRLLETKLNSLNSLVSCFYKIKSNFNVSRNSFKPIPKVDSTVLTLTKRSDLLLTREELEEFINFKRNLFSYKRKKLSNLLKDYSIDNLDIDLNKRVENLSLNQLLYIFRKINF